jgi:pilus assembly protein Flp/PilA
VKASVSWPTEGPTSRDGDAFGGLCGGSGFRLRRTEAQESGASLVEYGLLVALIAVVCIVAVSLLGNNASNKFSQVGSALQ